MHLLLNHRLAGIVYKRTVQFVVFTIIYAQNKIGEIISKKIVLSRETVGDKFASSLFLWRDRQ